MQQKLLQNLGRHTKWRNLQLNIFPEKFRILESNIEKQKEIRRMPVDNYSVFYVIKENRVIIISVLYSASNIQAKLKTNL